MIEIDPINVEIEFFTQSTGFLPNYNYSINLYTRMYKCFWEISVSDNPNYYIDHLSNTSKKIEIDNDYFFKKLYEVQKINLINVSEVGHFSQGEIVTFTIRKDNFSMVTSYTPTSINLLKEYNYTLKYYDLIKLNEIYEEMKRKINSDNWNKELNLKYPKNKYLKDKKTLIIEYLISNNQYGKKRIVLKNKKEN